jgi:hypothetical protein
MTISNATYLKNLTSGVQIAAVLYDSSATYLFDRMGNVKCCGSSNLLKQWVVYFQANGFTIDFPNPKWLDVLEQQGVQVDPPPNCPSGQQNDYCGQSRDDRETRSQRKPHSSTRGKKGKLKGE